MVSIAAIQVRCCAPCLALQHRQKNKPRDSGRCPGLAGTSPAPARDLKMMQNKVVRGLQVKHKCGREVPVAAVRRAPLMLDFCIWS
jgi:hypothetical protein